MNQLLDGQIFVEQRPALFRYALLQIRDVAVADDLVQDTLLAALQTGGEFQGKSTLRTWLIGILKHKIADHWRRVDHEELPPSVSISEEGDGDDDDECFFLSDGHWTHKPKTWADPETALNQIEFWSVYEICQQNLPPTMAKVFMLRELVGLEASEICLEAEITEANYWVTMHRARMRLRECLEIRWFGQE